MHSAFNHAFYICTAAMREFPVCEPCNCSLWITCEMLNLHLACLLSDLLMTRGMLYVLAPYVSCKTTEFTNLLVQMLESHFKDEMLVWKYVAWFECSVKHKTANHEEELVTKRSYITIYSSISGFILLLLHFCY